MNRKLMFISIAIGLVTIISGLAYFDAKEKKNPSVIFAAQQTTVVTSSDGMSRGLSIILGRPTDRSVVINVVSPAGGEAYVEWGMRPGEWSRKTSGMTLQAGVPSEIEINGLKANTRYYYRLMLKTQGQALRAESENSFNTQRSPGSTFTFALQSDSHPERQGKMFDSGLYEQTLRNVAKDQPDFYLTLGDDFSIERFINRQSLSQENINQVYAQQHRYLGIVGSSSPIFPVNGNHEQAALYLLDGTPNNAAVMAAKARNKFFALPAPDQFYGGDAEKVEHVGLLRDYYAWTWGDALFVVIDPYWHSPDAVDNRAGDENRKDTKKSDRTAEKSGKGNRDLWQITLGDVQYRWLVKTLSESKARWKFVFAHHVNGTGRGGVELAGQYEWGGKDRRGQNLFREKRPGWALPIHELMVKTGVTIFFQGHDHLYARQELDGIIYQTVPSPADPTYQAFNREAYRSGDIFPNSGHLRVTVSANDVRVDYVRSFLVTDEKAGASNGIVSHSYSVRESR